MRNIQKRSEKQEEFDSKKIEKSIKSAGAEEKMAQEISRGVLYTDGMKTSEVRKHVTEKLTLHDTKLGRIYEAYKKPAPVHK